MSEETIKVEPPEIPGFERYEVGERFDPNNTWRIRSDGTMQKETWGAHVSVLMEDYVHYRRIEPKNPPLPKWNEDNVPVIPFIKSRDLPDDVIAKAVERAVYYWNHPKHECWNGGLPGRYERLSTSKDLDDAFYWSNTDEGYDFWYDINYATQKKQPALSFETWQGARVIAARLKATPNCKVLVVSLPDVVQVHLSADDADEISYAEADRDYETLDGGKIGRG